MISLKTRILGFLRWLLLRKRFIRLVTLFLIQGTAEKTKFDICVKDMKVVSLHVVNRPLSDDINFERKGCYVSFSNHNVNYDDVMELLTEFLNDNGLEFRGTREECGYGKYTTYEQVFSLSYHLRDYLMVRFPDGRNMLIHKDKRNALHEQLGKLNVFGADKIPYFTSSEQKNIVHGIIKTEKLYDNYHHYSYYIDYSCIALHYNKEDDFKNTTLKPHHDVIKFDITLSSELKRNNSKIIIPDSNADENIKFLFDHRYILPHASRLDFRHYEKYGVIIEFTDNGFHLTDFFHQFRNLLMRLPDNSYLDGVAVKSFYRHMARAINNSQKSKKYVDDEWCDGWCDGWIKKKDMLSRMNKFHSISGN